ncbi:MAG: (4Fe-4S)-binding protein [Cyclobacteriaceae bacterium]
MKDITKKYTNGEVTVVWKPNECIHSTICFKGLGEVFDPSKRPWITPEGATTEKIIEQVKKCPSGALSYYLNRDEDDKVKVEAETIVETMPNGPLLVYGNVAIKDKEGNLQ